MLTAISLKGKGYLAGAAIIVAGPLATFGFAALVAFIDYKIRVAWHAVRHRSVGIDGEMNEQTKAHAFDLEFFRMLFIPLGGIALITTISYFLYHLRKN